MEHYKVVISQNDTTPQYNENGYLYAISDRSTTSCTADNSSKYNGTSDFGYYLTVGQKYYVAITYVFNDCKITSNVLEMTYGGPPVASEPTAAFSPILDASTDAEGLHLTWTGSPADRELTYYKVVISQNDTTPQYSDNGWLVYFTETSTTSYLVNNSTAYNGGDFGEYLIAGTTYHVAITYVFSDGKITSNVQDLIYSGPAGPTA